MGWVNPLFAIHWFWYIANVGPSQIKSDCKSTQSLHNPLINFTSWKSPSWGQMEPLNAFPCRGSKPGFKTSSYSSHENGLNHSCSVHQNVKTSMKFFFLEVFSVSEHLSEGRLGFVHLWQKFNSHWHFQDF